MVSVLIICHDRREGDFFGRLCRLCVKPMEKESVYSFIVSNMNYQEADIRRIIPPELIIAEIMDRADLERTKYIRNLFSSSRLLLLCNNQISPECYVIPEISPDTLLLKPYVYSEAVKALNNILLWCYKDRNSKQKMGNQLKIHSEGEIYYFNYAEICYLEARDKKIIAHMNEGEIAFYDSLQELEKRVPEYFIRCHRSYIVNFMFIEKADLANSIFYLNTKTVIPISQKYKTRLAKILKKYKDSEGNLG